MENSTSMLDQYVVWDTGRTSELIGKTFCVGKSIYLQLNPGVKSTKPFERQLVKKVIMFHSKKVHNFIIKGYSSDSFIIICLLFLYFCVW